MYNPNCFEDYTDYLDAQHSAEENEAYDRYLDRRFSGDEEEEPGDPYDDPAIFAVQNNPSTLTLKYFMP
jgi:hypothetical protein